MDPSILFASGLINIIVLLVAIIFIYITLRVMLVLGPKEARKSMMFPILIAGILLLPMAGTELYRNLPRQVQEPWIDMLVPLHGISMLLVILVLTFGVYRYYRMLKKAYAWEHESQKS